MVNDKETEQKINQLQIYEQSLQNIILQRQQIQSQINEMNSAIKGLETSQESYRIIGNIMVKTDKQELKKEIEEKKTTSELRIKSLEKQEQSIKEKIQSIQSDVMKTMPDSE